MTNELDGFIEAARREGASDQVVVELLRHEGWSEKEIYTALGAYYERRTGMAVPSRKTSRETARDAFLYLLSFFTLGAWTIALGSLWFSLIESWFPDALAHTRGADFRHSAASSLASLVVAFPVYLLTQRLIAREIAPIRKWLTYIALLIAAGIVIGDLITFVSYFLSGELTVRFVLKVVTVLLIAGGVFWYYLGSLRPARAGARLFLAAACGVVALALLVGFAKLGSPADQRLIEADRQRAEDLLRVAGEVNEYWKAKGELPPRIDGPYEYRSLGGSRYELCAAFATEGSGGRYRFLAHPRGRHCFALDAALPVSSLRP